MQGPTGIRLWSPHIADAYGDANAYLRSGTGFSDQITEIARYFDPAAAPAATAGLGNVDFLAWLASWLGLTLDRHWPEVKRRWLASYTGHAA